MAPQIEIDGAPVCSQETDNIAFVASYLSGPNTSVQNDEQPNSDFKSELNIENSTPFTTSSDITAGSIFRKGIHTPLPTVNYFLTTHYFHSTNAL
jgi:hypothetical protein